MSANRYTWAQVYAALRPLALRDAVLENVRARLGGSARRFAYIAGPMTGRPTFNAPAFDAKRKELAGRGYLVHSPVDIARSCGLDLENPDCLEDQGVPLEVLVRADLVALLESDEVHLLEGWEASPGTALELVVARACAIPVARPGEETASIQQRSSPWDGARPL